MIDFLIYDDEAYLQKNFDDEISWMNIRWKQASVKNFSPDFLPIRHQFKIL